MITPPTLEPTSNESIIYGPSMSNQKDHLGRSVHNDKPYGGKIVDTRKKYRELRKKLVAKRFLQEGKTEEEAHQLFDLVDL